ncbi:uncharacterized protein LOC125667720 isoform X2 [Ostrea edulis]|uniref:uncharacterized protein LOC125667720 isoform X2 n=1 Tax=Ostrea edulis TaxID=37623 RepID=UPI002095ADF2|nr:uncharacterized protein LOC125667720 isoform X2 [Ostrea edulis]
MRTYTFEIYVALITVLLSIKKTTLTSVGISHGGGISKLCETNNITLSYTISNDVEEPSFDYSINVTGPQGQPFIRFMEQAADKNRLFQFSAKYHSGLGYLVHTVNEVSGTHNKTYWHLMRAPSEKLSVGISKFIPVDGNHLILKFSQVKSWTLSSFG